MKAIVQTKYGTYKDLHIKELPIPAPGDNEILIKVKATAINDYDWSMMRGKPFLYRLLFGITKPKHPVPGMELSGVIEKIGDKVQRFKVGDTVYGDLSDHGFGSHAEYVCINEKAVNQKPECMTFVDAASLPHASMLAWQALIDAGKIQKGYEILINGAGGGVGTLGLQIAKQYDARVTGIDTGEKLSMMHNEGFDRVLDYKETDFTKEQNQYDIILDCKTNRLPLRYLKCLKSNGVYATVGGTNLGLLQTFLIGVVLKPITQKKLCVVTLKPNKDLDKVNEMCEKGLLNCVIDGPHEFEKIPELIQYFGEGKHSGKVVVRVDAHDDPVRDSVK